tara:strand:+ start:44585 stop:45175 length:591 start_codon:yes stop_codon:yes gene_type:complete
MAEVNSTFELRRGAIAPDFELPEGGAKKKHSLEDLAEGKSAIVILFACNHCPYVVHLADYVGEFADEYAKKGVQFVAINSNDAKKYPDDAPEKMKEFSKAHDWNFPYLFDEDQNVAKSYSAACTPDFYVFNQNLELTYTGQFDNSRPGNSAPITGADLRTALESTLRNGKADSVRMRPSSGCNIKWKKGNEPAYFG